MTDSVASLIDSGAREMGVDLTSAQVERLADYLSILIEWNHRFGLVGPGDPSSLVRKHLLDCLAPVKVLHTRQSVIDIGSGGGLPGVPVSLCCPDLPVILVDRRRARVSFLKDVIRRLSLGNARAVEGRIEKLVSDHEMAGTLDAAISRAWTGLPRFLDVCAKLLRSGGIAVSMKGPRGRAELAEIDPGAFGFKVPEAVPYTLPAGCGNRLLLVFERF